MSAKPLWVRWYSTDILGSGRVARMTRDEEYLYRRLLDYQAADGFIEPDPRRLAFACKMSPEEFERAWAAIRDCFEPIETGRFPETQTPRFENLRMAAERERSIAAQDSARENGKRGGRPKKADRKPAGSFQETGRVTGRVTQTEPGGKASREPRAEIPTPDGVGGHSPSAPPRSARQPTFAKADALAMLPPEHALELGPTWARWIEHVWARKKPTRTAVESHLASFCEVWAKRGAKAACELLDGGIASNAQGIPGWAKERALSQATNGHAYNGRMSAAEREEARSAAAMDRFAGPDRPRVADLASYLAANPRT